MVEDLCRNLLKVFHRALGLPLFSAMTVELCLHLDSSSRKYVVIDSSLISTPVDCTNVTLPYLLILLLKAPC